MDDQTNQVGVRLGEAERAPGSGAAALGRGGRMSRQRKTAAVLRLLRGEDLETVSRELGRHGSDADSDQAAEPEPELLRQAEVIERNLYRRLNKL